MISTDTKYSASSFNEDVDAIVQHAAAQSQAARNAQQPVAAKTATVSSPNINQSTRSNSHTVQRQIVVTKDQQVKDVKGALLGSGSNTQWRVPNNSNTYILNRYFDDQHANRVLALSAGSGKQDNKKAGEGHNWASKMK